MSKDTEKQPSVVRYHILLAIVVAIWGSTLVSTKILINEGMRPDEIFYVRFLLAYICVWFISPRKLWADGWRHELMMLLLGITGGSLYFIMENLAVKYTYVNNVSFIVSTSPIITMILVLLTYRYLKVKRILIVGSILALLGVAIVIFNGQVVLHLGPKGDIIALLTALSFGVYCYLIRLAGDRYDSIFITRKMFGYGLLSSLPILLFDPWQFEPSRLLEPSILLNLLFLGVIASFVCFAIYNACITHVGAVTSSNYLYFIPVSTIIFSAIFLEEPMTFIAYIGCALILIGVIMANIGCADDD